MDEITITVRAGQQITSANQTASFFKMAHARLKGTEVIDYTKTTYMTFSLVPISVYLSS